MDIPRIHRAAVELMMRDHVEDVRRLNSKLGHGNSAELSEDVPPNPFVGDPSSLERGNCIAIMGINPALDREMKPRFVKNEILIPLSCKEDFLISRDIISFNRWIKKIRNYYFSDAYNGKYFTTIGKKLGATWFIDQATSDPDLEMAKTILHNNTVKFDSIPYYSINADSLSSEKVAEHMETDPALKCHIRCIEALIEETRPKKLLVNGINVAGAVAREHFIAKETLEQRSTSIISKTGKPISINF